MNFQEFYENIEDYEKDISSSSDKKLYYVAMTGHFEETHHIIAIADNMAEAVKLVDTRVPLNCQIITLDPMTRRELGNWLDKIAEEENKKKISYKFFHGKNINKNLTTL